MLKSRDIDLVIRVFAGKGRSQDGKPPVRIFQHPLMTYVAAGGIQGTEAVFEEYRRLSSEGLLNWQMDSTEFERREGLYP